MPITFAVFNIEHLSSVFLTNCHKKSPVCYGAVYDEGVERVAALRRDQSRHLELMQPSYRRQKPTNSVRRGLLQKLNEFKQNDHNEVRIRGGHATDAKYWSPADRQRYAQASAAVRTAYGLTDGLKLNQKDFNDYLARRRAEDKQRRGW